MIAITKNISAQTTLQAGDIAIVGYNTNLGTICSPTHQSDDLIAFLTFKDITTNTEIILTDEAYLPITGTNHIFRTGGEGLVKFTRTGGTIPAGTIFYVAFGGATDICGTGTNVCASGWSTTALLGSNISGLDFNSSMGDQLFILQGTFTNSGTNYNFVGNFIYAITTTGVWTSGGNTSSSNLPSLLNCLNFNTTNRLQARYISVITTNTRSGHLTNIYDTGNWASMVTIMPACPTNLNFTFQGLPASIVINPEPTNGNAGADQNICQTTTTMAAMGTGTWSLISGTGTLSSNTNRNASVSGLSSGVNIFRWTASNCAISEVKINVGSTVTPSVSITSSPVPTSSICQGNSVTFTATAINGGTNPSYQWQVNNVNLSTNSPTFTTTTLNNNDQIKVILTSNNACAVPNTATSNVISFTVSPLVIPTINVTSNANNNTICQGENVTFIAVSTSGGTAPIYQWFVNNVSVGTNSTTYTSNNIMNTIDVKVRLTSNAPCLQTTNVIDSSVVRIVVRDCNVYSLFIPDLFSPNQDNANDKFKIEGDNSVIKDFEIKIFDRFGNMVYQSNNFLETKTNGWDGTSGGTSQPTGTYSWQIKGSFINNQTLDYKQKTKGNIFLIR